MKSTTYAIIFFMAIATPAWAGRSVGFDTSEFARFSRVVCSVGYIQDATSLIDSPDLIKQFNTHHARQKSYRAISLVQRRAFDKVIAVGLSATEMKNLGVIGGDTVNIDAYNRTTKATVYRAFGAFRPPEGSINLSLAAAKRLKLRAGDGVIIRKDFHRKDPRRPFTRVAQGR